MRFEDAQKVTGLDRNMLAHVAHKEHAHIMLFRQPKQFCSLPIGL
jgi:hypothetical protein